MRVRASYYLGQLTTPKSGKVRSVPMAPDVARALAALGRRLDWVGDEDLVFVGVAGGYLDGSALRRRYKTALTAAGLRRLRFHDLRHTFGTRMIAKADIRRLQEWMGHADIQTTMRYLHYAPREEDARLVAEAFAVDPVRSAPKSQDLQVTPGAVLRRTSPWCHATARGDHEPAGLCPLSPRVRSRYVSPLNGDAVGGAARRSAHPPGSPQTDDRSVQPPDPASRPILR